MLRRGRALLGAASFIAGCAAADPSSGSVADLTDAEPSTTAPSTSGAASGSATTIDLGAVRPGQEVRIDVPRGALGLNIVVTGEASARVGIASLIAPTGDVVVAEYRPTGSESTVALGSRGISAFSVPMTNATATSPLATGAWRLVVGGIVVDESAPVDKSGRSLPEGRPLSDPVHVTVTVQRSSDGAFHGGELDLHVYVPDGLVVQGPGPAHAVTAETAPSDEALRARIDVFYTELERLFGIGRGAVAFHPIGAEFLSAKTGDERAGLIAQAAVPVKQALQVVLTNHVSYTDGPPLLGYSVGMPGAANVAASVRSAILVGLYPDQTPENDAVTFLHELGHFVGLLHSTDEDGTPDLLDDTPTCTEKKRTLCADVENLMTPNGPLHRTEVSPSQVRVVRGSPLYRARAR